MDASEISTLQFVYFNIGTGDICFPETEMPVKEDPYYIVYCLFVQVENFPCGADTEDFIMGSPIFGTITLG
jgi:hypothetical protein